MLNSSEQHTQPTLFGMPPGEVIGDRYLYRWFLIPRNRFFNIYIHCFLGSDDDRALHDHPWHSLSVLLKGRLKEHKPNGILKVPRWLPQFRKATLPHRIELIEGPAWTIFIRSRKIREWGFFTDTGWIHWRHFNQKHDIP